MKLILVLAALLSFAQSSHAGQAMILDQAYAEDPTGKLTFAQARKLPLTPFTGTLLKGYTASTIWVRARMALPEGADDLFLTVEPQFIDEIALYNPRQPQAPPAFTGDRHPDQRPDHLWHGNIFHLYQPSSEYWLRIRTTSTIIVKLNLVDEKALHQQARGANRTQDIYVGILIVFLLWAAVMAATQRAERVVLAFFAQQFSSLLMSLSYYGYLRQWFAGWPHTNFFDFTTSFLLITTTAATMNFHYALIATNDPRNKHINWLKGI